MFLLRDGASIFRGFSPGRAQTTWLPKLPVPALEQTMAGYLDAVEVAVTDESQRRETRRRVEQFMRKPDGIGHKLQDLLVEKQANEDNWVFIAPLTALCNSQRAKRNRRTSGG